ncbi:putative ankyrin repeat-containing domain, PGG domain, ankyrin repeat-containing domain superfamily [Helianthus annuus]|nr:putative ankyrin repeat-containing domain, PGG domain, ankyrin repeat-containing domain superfamily [Helianthus annuus]KAJ0632741.1 putative ankyrin repeat-containing domain, PGG domain, ankyrin repeat-containing domain superfamily [Helianthus annuus]
MHFQVYDLDGFLSELKINNKSVAPEFLDNLYNGLLGSDASKNSVLHLVSKIGNVACVEYILQKDPLKIYDHNSDTETPAFVAAREGRVDILRLHILKARNQDIEPIVTRSADKQNALHIAIQNHHVEVIFLLIKEIPQLTNRINESEESPLYLAAEAGYFGVVEHMLNKCKNISFQGPNGKTSLHAAATSDSAADQLVFSSWAITTDIICAHDTASALSPNEIQSEAKEKQTEKHFVIVDSLVVVAALIATASFAAAFTMPGGLESSDGFKKGTPFLLRDPAFQAFIVTNAIAFSFSCCSLLLRYLFMFLVSKL